MMFAISIQLMNLDTIEWETTQKDHRHSFVRSLALCSSV